MNVHADKKILIIVPAYNEQGNIKNTLSEILSIVPKNDVVVVDDGSCDDTSGLASELGVHVVSLPFNLGIGAAMQTGFRFALSQNYDIAVQVDGDGQHDISYLSTLLEPVLSGKADMSTGSRFLPPFLGYRSSIVRRIGITFFAHLISVLTANTVTDPTSGFRAYSKKIINLFAEYYPHDFPEPEAIMIARQNGMRVCEVPVEMRKRLSGLSSIRYLKTLYYMIKVTFAILLNMVKQKKR